MFFEKTMDSFHEDATIENKGQKHWNWRNMMRLTVDRFEGDYAICELESGEFVDLPRKALPEGVTEGSKLSIEVVDAEKTEDQDRIRNKMNQLFKD